MTSTVKRAYNFLIRKYSACLYSLGTMFWVKRDFEDVFNNKKVIIIGPADTALDYCSIDVVHRFDVIVRINKSFPVPDSIVYKIGSKTDVLFHSLNQNGFGGTGKIDMSLYVKHGLRFIFFPLNYRQQQSTLLDFKKQLKYPVKLLQPTKKQYNRIYKLLNNHIPTTGFSSIYWIIDSKPKELFVTGFSFYQTGYVSKYRDDVFDLSLWRKEITMGGAHDIALEFKIIRELFKKNPGYKVDTFIQNLFDNPNKVVF
jgi:hypothetical protein